MVFRAKTAVSESLLWNIMLLFGAFLYGSHGVLLNICKVNGKIPFNSAAVVFFIELSKHGIWNPFSFDWQEICGRPVAPIPVWLFHICILLPTSQSYLYHCDAKTCNLLLSVLMLLPEFGKDSRLVVMIPTLKQFMMFSIPAILYTINNNLVVHIQAYVDPASFQVLSNLKIVITVILYRIILKRSISMKKWIAFALITIAGASNSYGGWVSSQRSTHRSEMKVHVTFTGILVIFVFCCISGIAGVYTEYILKKQAKLPFALQSIMLYIFGVGINFAAFLMSRLWTIAEEDTEFKDGGNLFEGFSVWTGVIIGSQALSGIINGAIMKQASSLTRLVMIGSAMLVSTTLSVFIFNLQFNDYFITAFSLVILALVIYHWPDR